MDSRTTLISPEGTIGFQHLQAPDEYMGQKKYKVSMLIDKEQAKELKRKVIDTLMPVKNGKSPLSPQKGDDGKNTGMFYVRFQSNYKPPVFDKEGQRLMDRITGGSTLKVAYTPVVYTGGVSFRMLQVRVTNLNPQVGRDIDWGDGVVTVASKEPVSIESDPREKEMVVEDYSDSDGVEDDDFDF